MLSSRTFSNIPFHFKSKLDPEPPGLGYNISHSKENWEEGVNKQKCVTMSRRNSVAPGVIGAEASKLSLLLEEPSFFSGAVAFAGAGPSVRSNTSGNWLFGNIMHADQT